MKFSTTKKPVPGKTSWPKTISVYCRGTYWKKNTTLTEYAVRWSSGEKFPGRSRKTLREGNNLSRTLIMFCLEANLSDRNKIWNQTNSLRSRKNFLRYSRLHMVMESSFGSEAIEIKARRNIISTNFWSKNHVWLKNAKKLPVFLHGTLDSKWTWRKHVWWKNTEFARKNWRNSKKLR